MQDLFQAYFRYYGFHTLHLKLGTLEELRVRNLLPKDLRFFPAVGEGSPSRSTTRRKYRKSPFLQKNQHVDENRRLRMHTRNSANGEYISSPFRERI